MKRFGVDSYLKGTEMILTVATITLLANVLAVIFIPEPKLDWLNYTAIGFSTAILTIALLRGFG